jgi:hypothetical protein
VANEPRDPFTELMSAAVSMHEMYVTWVTAGFTEEQAFKLTQTALAAAISKQEQEGD